MNPKSATEAVESERAQIGHEIHDALLPLIFGAAAYLQNHLDGPVADHADREKLEHAHRLLSEAQEIGRSLLVQIYPPELTDTAWTLAVRQTVQNLLDPSIEVEWRLDEQCHSFPVARAASAYRIIVEAVRNAIRHGKATKITIDVCAKELSVTDNGSGFDPASVGTTRFGIRSMKGRAALVGGALEIKTKPGGPTTVRVLFDE